jgi:undecaprenyl-diphosphatase
VATAISGELIDAAMKHAFNRPRPTIVPHLRVAFDELRAATRWSPRSSSHAGRDPDASGPEAPDQVLLSRDGDAVDGAGHQPRVRAHYPTDVLGGWIIGFVWASVCWLWRSAETQTGIEE